MSNENLLAHHEAAHAVVAIALGYPVEGMTIVASEDSLGVCTVQYGNAYRVLLNSHATADKKDARMKIIGLLAGIAAEISLTGH